MMKKLISLLCVLTMVIGIIAVSAVSTSAAVDSAKTQIEVKNGQDVTYRLKLSEVESKVVGTDFSVYYDSSVLEPVSVLDFNDNDEENWNGNWLANYKKDGEVLCNFSVVRGVDFKEPRSVITINFKAKANATTDITYFVRYLYDYRPFTEEAMKNKSQPQITEFKYTCDVTVDGDPRIRAALSIPLPATARIPTLISPAFPAIRTEPLPLMKRLRAWVTMPRKKSSFSMTARLPKMTPLITAPLSPLTLISPAVQTPATALRLQIRLQRPPLHPLLPQPQRKAIMSRRPMHRAMLPPLLTKLLS